MGAKGSKYADLEGEDAVPDDGVATEELPPEAVDELASTTHWNVSQVNSLLNTFNDNQVFGVGLDKSTFGKLFKLSGEMLDTVFSTFDVDGSGYINAREFIVGLSTVAKGSVDERLAFAFDVYDMNDDGTITREELATLLRSSLSTTCALVKMMFQGLGDAIGSIDASIADYETQTAGVTTGMPAPAPPQLSNLPMELDTLIEMTVEEIFEAADKAGDNVLSREEFVTWAKANSQITKFLDQFQLEALVTGSSAS